MTKLLYQYTDKDAFNAIRSQITWTFSASQPPGENAFGAYFTNLLPDNRQICKKLRIPLAKVEFCFEFADIGDLQPKEGGRGAYIFYSTNDYRVGKDRQRYNGLRDGWKKVGTST